MISRKKANLNLDLNVSLQGPVGEAEAAIVRRFSQEPFSSLAWLRADLTGETVSAFDQIENHTWYRPFKNFSGDISGRYLECMALLDEGLRPQGIFTQLLQTALKCQHSQGYFSATGDIDWNQPVDHGNIHTARMMPALWGNSRMLCGLVEAARATQDESALASARRLGDFYNAMLDRFADESRLAEYRKGDTFAAGYVTCYFPAIEGLAKLYQLCRVERYLETATRMASFYRQFDVLPIDHSHGMLCCQVGLLLLHEATGDQAYLDLVEARWQELTHGGYINPAGGILEKCRPVFFRDEGCALVDWLRLNLELARLTGKHQYWDMAERVLQNHLLLNQCPNGGFGHRITHKCEHGIKGFKPEFEEATWCCCFHGLLGFQLLKKHLVCLRDSEIRLPLPLDFTAQTPQWKIKTVLSRQDHDTFVYAIEADTDLDLSIRRPGWAGKVSAVDAAGRARAFTDEDGWLTFGGPIGRLRLLYSDCAYSEQHHTGSPSEPLPVFNYIGPWILAADRGKRPVPVNDLKNNEDVVFWQGGGGCG